jgi:hypothetical protein
MNPASKQAKTVHALGRVATVTSYQEDIHINKYIMKQYQLGNEFNGKSEKKFEG